MSANSITSSNVRRLLSEGQRFRNNFKNWLLKQGMSVDGTKWELHYGRGNIRVSLSEDHKPPHDAPEKELMKKYVLLSEMYDKEKERRDLMPYTLAKKRETGKSAAKRAHDHLKSAIVSRCKEQAWTSVENDLEMDPEVQELLDLDQETADSIIATAVIRAKDQQEEQELDEEQ